MPGIKNAASAPRSPILSPSKDLPTLDHSHVPGRMPNFRLAWAPLTVIVTVAIYLHFRGFPAVGPTTASAPPPLEELAPAEPSVDETSAYPGQNLFHLVEIFAHLEVASPGATATLTDEVVTPPNQTVANSQVAHQRPDLVAELPTVLHREDLAKANALKDQSSAFLDLGQRQEALAAITEATNLFRALALKHPAAFNAELASSLRVLSSCLGDVGRREKALLAIEEAVELQRALAKERPLEFKGELASSLNHHSNRLSRLARHEEALLAIQESVDLYRVVAENQPEASRPGLAASLYNLSTRLSKYDLQEEALAAIQEASSIYQKLAAEDFVTYEKKHKLSLAKLSGCLKGLGRKGKAITASKGATGIAGIGEVPPIRRTHGEAVSFSSQSIVS